MLGNIEKALIAKMLATQYGDDEKSIPTEAYLATVPSRSAKSATELAPAYRIEHAAERSSSRPGSTVHRYTIDGVLPPTGDWLDGLAGPKAGWLRAFLTSVSVVQGERIADNPAQRVFAPRKGQRVELTVDDASGQPVGVKVFGAVRSDRVRLAKA
jgi:hypothetical protein